MIGPTEIKHVSEVKFLGVFIDEKLPWDDHVKSITKKYRKHKSNCTIYTKKIMYEFVLYTI